MTIIVPVIHHLNTRQTIRNIRCIRDAGLDHAMVIDMMGRTERLLDTMTAVREFQPQMRLGVNILGVTPERALDLSLAHGMDMTWTDIQLTQSSLPHTQTADRVAALLPPSGHTYFCAVAFKYQAHEPYPETAAAWARGYGFLPTTSGPATGEPADPELLRKIGAPCAVASGITPENAHIYAPLVTHMLVATGIESDHHNIDPRRLAALMRAVS